MSIRRVVPNVRAQQGADSRGFYVSVVDASPVEPHPDLTVEVADVDAAPVETGAARPS